MVVMSSASLFFCSTNFMAMEPAMIVHERRAANMMDVFRYVFFSDGASWLSGLS